MAKYKTEKGFAVQTLSSDTAASEAATGSWAAGGSLNSARRSLSGAGTRTANVVFGGYESANSAKTELYDGSAWTEVNDLNSARFGLRGIGTSTAAFGVGGGNPVPSLGNKVESWDGTNWTETTEINTGRMQFAGVSNQGTTTALIVAGGYTTTSVANTESWNGSAWTEVNDLNSAGSQGSSGLGTQTAALAAGSHPYASPQSCEQWDGSNWTEVAELNTPRGEDMGGNGTVTSGLIYGGYYNPPPASKDNTESWNGSTWTELADLSTAKYALSGSGANSTSAIAVGGNGPPNLSQTEEWTTTPAATFTKQNLGQVYFNSTSNAFKATRTIFGTGAWASGGNMPLHRDSHAGFGVQTATGAVGGRTTPGPSPALTTSVNTYIEYDGSSWSSGPTINQQRWLGEASGTLTAAILYTGSNPGSDNTITNVEIWNGSGWTETTDVNTARRSLGGAGITSGAALAYGGRDTGGSAGPAAVAITESWNGSAWTEVADLNTARSYNTGSGTVTTAIYAGGYTGTTQSALTEVYNGSAWTEIGDLNTARHGLSSSGDSSGALAFGGSAPPGTLAITESFDGTSWTEVADLAQSRYDHNSGGSPGSQNTTIATGGYSPSPGYLNATEEWNVPATVTNTTITVS